MSKFEVRSLTAQLNAPSYGAAAARGVAVLLLAAGACANPTAPSDAAPPLSDGAFLLTLLGDSTLCQDIKQPQAGTHVAVALTAGHDTGGTWIAHAATPEGGSFEMKLKQGGDVTSTPAGPVTPSTIPMEGTISGTAIDSFKFVPTYLPSGTSAVFGDRTSINGLRRYATYAAGQTTGPLTFSRSGVQSTCPAYAVSWSLNGPTTAAIRMLFAQPSQ